MNEAKLTVGEAVFEKKEGKYLTFNLDENVYGVPIMKVSEIIGIVPITLIPKTPPFIKGIINLRGRIIPVMDLRLKFDMKERVYDQNTCIMIINIEVKNVLKQIGVIVDIVSEVCNIPASEIEEPPSFSADNDNDFLIGVGKIKDSVVMLLDIEKVIFVEEIIHLFNKEN